MPGWNFSGAEGARTPGLLGAIQALSQLSYSPVTSHESYARPCPTSTRRHRQAIVAPGGEIGGTAGVKGGAV